ncbi:unnamed protein product [Moneuplotes crassus]|uniref:Uncharacterized protein n=1 Tax=Euplotes crassus TaxID=5936 RepID=A0AAD1U6M1_EUPCR|nr:unnamed protein product [Moneuplotes crassus]
MYLSSHIDKKEIKPRKRRQKHRRGHSVASKANPDLGNQNVEKDNLDETEKDIKARDTSCDYDPKIKHILQKSQHSSFPRTGKNNIRLLTKLKTRGNAFSAIPCKEMKFRKKKKGNNTKNQIQSVNNTSRNTIITQDNQDSHNKSVGKSTFRAHNSNSKGRNTKKNDSLCMNDTIEFKNTNRNFGKYLEDLGIKSPPEQNGQSIDQRIKNIREKHFAATQVNLSSQEEEPDLMAEPQANDEEHDHSDLIIDSSSKYEENKNDGSEEIEQPDDIESSKEIEYDPKIQIPNAPSTILSEDQADRYEKVLKEMVEIENLINMNKVIFHYNMLESWCNSMISSLQAKQEKFRINKYETGGFSPHVKDYYDKLNMDKFKTKINPNKPEILALSLKKQLRWFYNRREKYFGPVKTKSKNLFEHVLTLGRLKSPSKILKIYKEMKGTITKMKEPRVNVNSKCVGIRRNKIMMRKRDSPEITENYQNTDITHEFHTNFYKYMKSRERDNDLESLQTPECQIKIKNHSSLQSDISSQEDPRSLKVLHQVYKGRRLNHEEKEKTDISGKPQILNEKEFISIHQHFNRIESLCFDDLENKNIVPSPNCVQKVVSEIIENLDREKETFAKTWMWPQPGISKIEDLIQSIIDINSEYISKRCNTFLEKIKSSQKFSGKITQIQLKELISKCLKSLNLEYVEASGILMEVRKQEFSSLCEEFRDCLYQIFNLPPFHYPKHVLLPNDSYADIDILKVYEPMVHKCLNDGQYHHHGLIIVLSSMLSEQEL